jgi:predicted O-methyltransferase YrrM
LNIVEIGMTRRWGSQYREGYSTPFFAHLAARDGHNLYSIDINPELIPLNERILKAHGLLRDNIRLIAADGMEVLKNWNKGPIDVLYLDGWDYDPDDLRRRVHFWSEKMHLKAMRIAEPRIPPGGLVLVDDMLHQVTMVGKGTRVIPWLAERGWECIEQGWQVLMRKPS